MGSDTPGAPTTRPRLIIADDHQMIVESFAAALGGQYDIVGTAFDGDGLASLVTRQAADCLLLGLMMPRTDGLDVIPRVRRLQPGMKVVIVTVLEDRAMAHAAIGAGADGFVPKIAGIAELKSAISEVLAGRQYVSPLVPKTTDRMGVNAVHPLLANLTPREHEVVLLLGDAKSETEIAKVLGLHISTVALHKHNAMRKLGMGTGAALVTLAVLLRTGAA